jgi:hypothetical protein
MVGRSKIGRWVEETATQRLAVRSERMAAMESNSAIRAPRIPEPTSGAMPHSASTGDSEMPTTAFGGSGVISAPMLQPLPSFQDTTRRSRGAMAWPVVAGLLTVAALAAGVVGFVALRHRGQPRPQVVTLPPATASIAPLAPQPPEPASAMATAAAPPASTSAPVPTTAVSMLPLAPLPRAPVGAVPVYVAPHPVGPAPHPAADCNPPYYFNAQGDRIFKKDCL